MPDVTPTERETARLEGDAERLAVAVDRSAPPALEPSASALERRKRGALWMRVLSVLARLAVAAAGVGYIAYVTHWHDYTPAGESVPRLGMLTLLQQASWWKLVLGLVLLAAVWPLQTTRWWWLLATQGIVVSWFRTFRLTMVGLFFNFCVPVGSTGGDVLKAYYAASGSSHKLGAVLSIVADRLTGMMGLVVLAALIGLLRLDDPVVQRIVLIAWAGMISTAIGVAMYVSPRWRRWLGINRVARIKGLRQLDHVLLSYGRRPWVLIKAVAISTLGHLCLAASAASAGYALGLDADPVRVMTALPLTYQGLGVMEAVALPLIGGGEHNVNPVVGMLILYRLFMLMYAVLGAIGLLGGSIGLQGGNSDTTDATSRGATRETMN